MNSLLKGSKTMAELVCEGLMLPRQQKIYEEVTIRHTERRFHTVLYNIYIRHECIGVKVTEDRPLSPVRSAA